MELWGGSLILDGRNDGALRWNDGALEWNVDTQQ
jgi:hypothetical protein